MKPNQIKNLRQIAVRVAREAGALILKQFNKPHHVEKKDIFDLVTEVDKAANTFVVQKLLALWPNSVMIAEEDNPDIQSVLQTAQTGCVLWIIDPIDGTSNYAKNVPHSAISIAAFDITENCLVVGVIYDPFRNECFSAGLGQGAFLNAKRIQVTDTKDISEALIATGICYKESMGDDNNISEIALLMTKCLGIRRYGAASLDLAWVAMGRFDAYWEKDLKPWDIAAGMLLVTEAQGRISTYSNQILNPFSGQVVASNGYLHDDFVHLLQKARRDAHLPDEPFISQ